MGGTNLRDGELASRIARGNQDALAQVFHEYGGAVKSVAMRILRDETLADDVVQDTFVWLWRSPERYDPSRGSLRTFLLTVAHRRAVDVVRSETARARREGVPPDSSSVAGLEDEVLKRQLSEHVRSALIDLSDDERVAISLAYYGGLSYVQVADRLGAPEGTVKSRIRSGMRKLATSLEGLAP